MFLLCSRQTFLSSWPSPKATPTTPGQPGWRQKWRQWRWESVYWICSVSYMCIQGCIFICMYFYITLIYMYSYSRKIRRGIKFGRLAIWKWTTKSSIFANNFFYPYYVVHLCFHMYQSMYETSYVVVPVFSQEQPALLTRPSLGSSLTWRGVEWANELDFVHICASKSKSLSKVQHRCYLFAVQTWLLPMILGWD